MNVKVSNYATDRLLRNAVVRIFDFLVILVLGTLFLHAAVVDRFLDSFYPTELRSVWEETRFGGKEVAKVVPLHSHTGYENTPLFNPVEKPVWEAEFLGILALLVLTGISPLRWWTRRRELLADNRIDWQDAERLRGAIASFGDPFKVPAREVSVNGSWIPLRIEICLNSDQRSDPGYRLGQGRGRTIVDLTQMSFVMWVENEEGKVIQVLGPSIEAQRVLFADSVRKWSNTRGSAVQPGSHLSDALNQFQFADEPIRSQPVINRIIANVETPKAERSNLLIQGIEVTPGCVFATQITAGNETQVVIPTGFFQTLAGELTSLTGKIIAPPQVADLAKLTAMAS